MGVLRRRPDVSVSPACLMRWVAEWACRGHCCIVRHTPSAAVFASQRQKRRQAARHSVTCAPRLRCSNTNLQTTLTIQNNTHINPLLIVHTDRKSPSLSRLWKHTTTASKIIAEVISTFIQLSPRALGGLFGLPRLIKQLDTVTVHSPQEVETRCEGADSSSSSTSNIAATSRAGVSLRPLLSSFLPLPSHDVVHLAAASQAAEIWGRAFLKRTMEQRQRRRR